MFQFGGLGALFCRAKSTKAPVATEVSRMWIKAERHTYFFFKLLQISAAHVISAVK